MSYFKYDLKTISNNDENKGKFTEEIPVPRESVDKYIDRACGECNRTILYKFRIPKNLSEEILFIINKLGISSSSIFPGYRGVADEISERLIKGLKSIW